MGSGGERDGGGSQKRSVRMDCYDALMMHAKCHSGVM